MCATYVRHGVKLKKESLSSKRALRGLEIARFSSLEQVELKIVRDQALSLTGALALIDAAIEGAAKKLDGYDGTVSIKSIGPRSAAVLLSGIGTIADFESADKLAAYLGIAPKVSLSNDTGHRGRITKRGNRLMRTTLVQCTLIAIRYSGYLNRLQARQGTPGRWQGHHRDGSQAAGYHRQHTSQWMGLPRFSSLQNRGKNNVRSIVYGQSS